MRYINLTFEYQIDTFLVQNMRYTGCLCMQPCLDYFMNIHALPDATPLTLSSHQTFAPDNVAKHHTIFARSNLVAWKRADLVGRTHIYMTVWAVPVLLSSAWVGNILLELLVNGGSLTPSENFSSQKFSSLQLKTSRFSFFYNLKNIDYLCPKHK